MSTKNKMTDVSATEMQAATGGINYATIQFLGRFSRLTPMQVSALKYYNRLDDPAKFQGLVPDVTGPGMPGTTLPRG